MVGVIGVARGKLLLLLLLLLLVSRAPPADGDRSGAARACTGAGSAWSRWESGLAMMPRPGGRVGLNGATSGQVSGGLGGRADGSR